MDVAITHLVQRLHESEIMTVLCVTGGGSQAIGWLLGVPNASRTVLEATVPYASAALTQFIGFTPKQSASPQTARRMAHAAYLRAVQLAESEAMVYGWPTIPPLVGISCTATIATGRVKRGEHRAFVAAWRRAGVRIYSVVFSKEVGRERVCEENIVSRVVLRALADAAEIAFDVPIPLAKAETIEVQDVQFAARSTPFEHFEEPGQPPAVTGEGLGRPLGPSDPLRQLLHGNLDTLVYPASTPGTCLSNAPVVGAIFPGSFNPLHQGHEKLAAVAGELLSCDVYFELSVVNADKAAIEETIARKRLEQFSGRYNVVVTRAPLFVDKARLFPNTTFVIGMDTYVRLVDGRYYSNSEQLMTDALQYIRSCGCSFLVAGRLDYQQHVFRTLGSTSVPLGYDAMFSSIPEEMFRTDISSTQLRTQGIVL